MQSVPDERGDRAAVEVYAFQWFDPAARARVVTSFKATIAAIEGHFGGTPLPATREVVEPGEIDGQGRWHRQPTGWGGLS